MGLDMYAFTLPAIPATEVDFTDYNAAAELHYWRKHPDLHGWMEALYYAKGGKAEPFNCVNLLLTAADLDGLEGDIRANRLPDTEGFFFGDSDGSETDDDLHFIAKARAALASGKAVFYRAWW